MALSIQLHLKTKLAATEEWNLFSIIRLLHYMMFLNAPLAVVFPQQVSAL